MTRRLPVVWPLLAGLLLASKGGPAEAQFGLEGRPDVQAPSKTGISVGLRRVEPSVGMCIRDAVAPAIPAPAGGAEPAVWHQLAINQQELENLQRQQAQAEQEPEAAQLQKRIELHEKQIDTLQKMIRLLAEESKGGRAAGETVERLETQAAALDARSRQAAERDQELARSVDTLFEQRDAEQRYGPSLPAPLKELFLPSPTNESPLSVYGTLVSGYTDFQDRPGEFELQEFAPFFLLQLNERILLEAEIEFGLEETELSQIQADFLVNDWLTVVAGRFLAPIGFYNERLHPDWINKLPDAPLMFRQVSPGDFSLNGVQARGAHYLGGWPAKLEYALYVTNGMGLDVADPELSELANLGELREGLEEVNDAKAVGGRVGLWVPEPGLTAGVSGYFNGGYTPDAGDDIVLWQIDAGYRHGNWDLRFEYAQMYQEANTFIAGDIRRTGLYAQAAYRPYDARSVLLQNTELVFRYSLARFKGIDPAELELDEFATTLDLPVDRNQFTLGVNYYFYPSLVLKFAWEVNDEMGYSEFRDNVFLTQLAWGF